MAVVISVPVFLFALLLTTLAGNHVIDAQQDLPLRLGDQDDGGVAAGTLATTTKRPAFDLPLRYRIVEETPIGTPIADVALDAGLRRKHAPDVLAELEYRLLQDPAPVPVAIGLKTGLLATSGRVDRDELTHCRDQAECELTVDITVRPAKYFQVIKVCIVQHLFI